jgi:hypothetical protein
MRCWVRAIFASGGTGQATIPTSQGMNWRETWGTVPGHAACCSGGSHPSPKEQPRMQSFLPSAGTVVSAPSTKVVWT